MNSMVDLECIYHVCLPKVRLQIAIYVVFQYIMTSAKSIIKDFIQLELKNREAKKHNVPVPNLNPADISCL